MKTMFVHARSSLPLALTAAALKKLPKQRYGVVSTAQHLHNIREVLKQLPDSVLIGAVVGCRADNIKRVIDQIDAFLFVGTGEFHPIRVALEGEGKTVFIYDPTSKQLTTLDHKDIAAHHKRVQGRLLRFYHAKTVGLLVTTKVGQNNGVISTYSLDAKMSLPLQFMKRKDKKYYLFSFDTLNHAGLEDFNFIDCWVNFACNRIADDLNVKVVNVQDIMDAESAEQGEKKNVHKKDVDDAGAAGVHVAAGRLRAKGTKRQH